MKPNVSVIVVARNEEKTITRVIDETCTLLTRLTGTFEILVNDDASSDRTGKILDECKKRYKHIRVFHQLSRIGIAHGMEFLYQKARYEYVFTLPGDGQYTVSDLPAMLSKAGEGYDIVVGKRIRKMYTPERHLVSFLFNMLSRLLFGVDTIDAGSIKLYRRKVLMKFQLISRGVYNEAERIIRASKAGYAVGWVPARHIGRQGGHASGAKPALIREATVDMIRLWYLLSIAQVSPVTLK